MSELTGISAITTTPFPFFLIPLVLLLLFYFHFYFFSSQPPTSFFPLCIMRLYTRRASQRLDSGRSREPSATRWLLFSSFILATRETPRRSTLTTAGNNKKKKENTIANYSSFHPARLRVQTL
jgi:hypothetical protein